MTPAKLNVALQQALWHLSTVKLLPLTVLERFVSEVSDPSPTPTKHPRGVHVGVGLTVDVGDVDERVVVVAAVEVLASLLTSTQYD